MEATEIPVLLCGTCHSQLTLTRGKPGAPFEERRHPANWTVACTSSDCVEAGVAYKFGPLRTVTLERADGV